MRNLIVICLFFMLFLSSKGYGQAKVWLKFGDEAVLEGDFYSAAKFYDQAMAKDSTLEGLQYKRAVAYFQYHNYEKALPLFEQIGKDPILKLTYPEYQYYVASIYKHLGQYKMASKAFRTFVTTYPNKSDILYLRAKNEVKNFNKVFALLKDTAEVSVTNIGVGVNTGGAEFNTVPINDSTIYYSALRFENAKEDGEVIDKWYGSGIYLATKKDSVWKPTGQLVMEYSVANGSLDSTGGKFYFSVCDTLPFCRIYMANWKEGGLENLTRFTTPFNLNGFNFTQPEFVRIGKKEYLLFVSDMPGGKGGMDLWISELKRGVWSRPKNLGNSVNTPGNEISPKYDLQNSKLFFSSDWHYNLGGFDIFSAEGSVQRPKNIQNLGIPFNSSHNDLYYTIVDSLNGFLTSNRPGSLTDKDAVCCNDLYAFAFPKPEPIQDTLDLPSDSLTLVRLQKLVEEYHVTLYFHNDRPNPDNWDTVTPLTYMETYEDYITRIPTYRSEYSKRLSGEDSLMAVDEIQDFFDDYAHRGVEDLKIFLVELQKELDAGNRIELSVKGYASPLAKTDYNVNLTLRRINSLQNYLKVYEGGILNKYLEDKAANGGALYIKKVPFGEYRADTLVSDNFYDTRNSVYSKGAALERKIEIINLTLLSDTNIVWPFVIDPEKQVNEFDLGQQDSARFSWRFLYKNTADSTVYIDSIYTDCTTCIRFPRKTWQINPEEVEPIDIDFSLPEYKGLLGRKVYLKLRDGRIITLLIGFEL